ncbi:MAG: Lrp/AsnC ligand binding domain-containing protein [SAR202 cluster bacterium]|jgi:DNA-binding Lrp family transcriptional regulator|nr:Lrp/AsnC ligand binding domain-containing protein [SAR202 cluster bacterium]|tara:strand:- start:569 stop:808 length:240 start_codon:yes stop_codon:yes gene_type:complete
MPTKAYILIETAVGKSRDVTETLRSLGRIQTVDAVTGPYDIIAVVAAEDLNAVGDMVTSQIHTISGIVRTVTCLSVGTA